MQCSQAIHILGGRIAGGQGKQLAHKVPIAYLHGQVQRSVALLLLGAGTVQQLGHSLHMPVLGCQLQCCEPLGILCQTQLVDVTDLAPNIAWRCTAER